MTTPKRRQTVRRLQTAMATGYTGVGAWCFLHPTSVIAFTLTRKYVNMSNATTHLFARCFGAQAMICGLLLGTSEMTTLSFTVFGLAVPYLGAYFWFRGIGPPSGMVNETMWVDFIGNLLVMGGSFSCAKLLKDDAKSSSGEGVEDESDG
ncbi:hypothetical protein C8A00DRAFT_35498 [Chaetomidium leptoderma]|uniref:Uncharacterized protein n=1 Tax=Chaetomidium leptoderma TaxID=669021 RepID=A0AAN6VID6_9PEZI|nr:hypothetical protein C8A00DRAFT_35498 [Chaetomidium leptoderma]